MKIDSFNVLLGKTPTFTLLPDVQLEEGQQISAKIIAVTSGEALLDISGHTLAAKIEGNPPYLSAGSRVSFRVASDPQGRILLKVLQELTETPPDGTMPNGTTSAETAARGSVSPPTTAAGMASPQATPQGTTSQGLAAAGTAPPPVASSPAEPASVQQIIDALVRNDLPPQPENVAKIARLIQSFQAKYQVAPEPDAIAFVMAQKWPLNSGNILTGWLLRDRNLRNQLWNSLGADSQDDAVAENPKVAAFLTEFSVRMADQAVPLASKLQLAGKRQSGLDGAVPGSRAAVTAEAGLPPRSESMPNGPEIALKRAADLAGGPFMEPGSLAKDDAMNAGTLPHSEGSTPFLSSFSTESDSLIIIQSDINGPYPMEANTADPAGGLTRTEGQEQHNLIHPENQIAETVPPQKNPLPGNDLSNLIRLSDNLQSEEQIQGNSQPPIAASSSMSAFSETVPTFSAVSPPEIGMNSPVHEQVETANAASPNDLKPDHFLPTNSKSNPPETPRGLTKENGEPLRDTLGPPLLNSIPVPEATHFSEDIRARVPQTETLSKTKADPLPLHGQTDGALINLEQELQTEPAKNSRSPLAETMKTLHDHAGARGEVTSGKILALLDQNMAFQKAFQTHIPGEFYGLTHFLVKDSRNNLHETLLEWRSKAAKGPKGQPIQYLSLLIPTENLGEIQMALVLDEGAKVHFRVDSEQVRRFLSQHAGVLQQRIGPNTAVSVSVNEVPTSETQVTGVDIRI